VLVGRPRVLGGLLTFVISEFTTGLPQLQTQVGDSLDRSSRLARDGPLHLQKEQIQDFINKHHRLDQEQPGGDHVRRADHRRDRIGEMLTGFC
jgi:hypothetical protein